ncbi:integrase catalytic domain-containing protein [Trichonephila clavipes]|nr:integrase catalytic domain-containing protein [Trichonephila clavipes]
MDDLPKERITPDKVFNSTGIDLCGPFFIKNKYQRKGPEIKVYVCIFICLVTKAIHLEIISDLTSQALIAALKDLFQEGRITKSVQTIWKRWSLSYLNSLQQRKKWIVNKENLKLGDMVLIREENLPPCKWLLGRVVKIYMGKDKKVRVVDIKTGKGVYKKVYQ